MIIALEGHSFSGKTTLFNCLLLRKKGLTGIAEHDEYSGGAQNYPPFPAKNEDMARTSVDFFAGLEQRRAKDARQALPGEVVFDRSFMSVVIFQKYMKQLAIPGESHAYQYAKERFAQMASRGEVLIPDYLVFVRCDRQTYLARQSRFISVEYLRGEQALEFFEAEFAKLHDIYRKHHRAVTIYSNDAPERLEENASAVEAAFEGRPLKPAEKTELVRELVEAL